MNKNEFRHAPVTGEAIYQAVYDTEEGFIDAFGTEPRYIYAEGVLQGYSADGQYTIVNADEDTPYMVVSVTYQWLLVIGVDRLQYKITLTDQKSPLTFVAVY